MLLTEPEKKLILYIKEFPNFLSYFNFTFFASVTSPILIEMGKTFNTDPRDLNILLFYFALGSVAGRFSLLFYRNRFKSLNLIIFFNTILSGFVLVLYFINSLLLFNIIYFILGYILGINLILASEFLMESAIKNKERLITVSTFFVPVGAISGFIISPYMIKKGGDWKNIYLIFLFEIFLMLMLYIFTIKKSGYSGLDKKDNVFRIIEIFRNIKIYKAFLILCILMFFYVTSEFIMANWTPTFLRLQRSFDIQLAGLNSSVFWAAIAAGRIIFSFISVKLNYYKMILYFSIFALIFAILFLFIKTDYMIFILTSLIGLSFSILWPFFFYLGSTYNKKGRNTLINVILLASSAGTCMAPYLVKIVSKVNMNLSVAMVSFIFILIIIFLLILMNIKKKNPVLNDLF